MLDTAEGFVQPDPPELPLALALPGGAAQDLGPARAILIVTPRGEAALVLDAEMTGDPDGRQVARGLDVTCLKRGLLRLDGKTMIEWLREQADSSGLPLPDSLALGPNVHLFAAMTHAGAPVTASIAAARTEISELSAQLNELQLDLEFGVESYLDGVLIPEAIVEACQRSLCEALGIRTGLERSSRMLERFGAVIGGGRTALDAAIQEQAERRDRPFSGLLAVGTLLALPPTLLLACFALAPGTRRTIFDPRMCWAAYLIAFLPFISLFAPGWPLRRRIRASSDQLDVFEGAG